MSQFETQKSSNNIKSQQNEILNQNITHESRTGLVPNFNNFAGIDNNEQNFINLEEDENTYKQNESTNYFKIENIPDYETKNMLKLNEREDNFQKYLNDTSQKENM